MISLKKISKFPHVESVNLWISLIVVEKIIFLCSTIQQAVYKNVKQGSCVRGRGFELNGGMLVQEGKLCVRGGVVAVGG